MIDITYELRKFIEDEIWTADNYAKAFAIADRIDAEHQKAEQDLIDANNQMEQLCECSIKLPVDADGEPIHIGDKVTCVRSVWEVTGLRLTGLAWGVCCTIFNDHGGSGTNVYPPCDLRHYHAPTVDSILRDFGVDIAHALDADPDATVPEAIIAEFASKLQLRGDA